MKESFYANYTHREVFKLHSAHLRGDDKQLILNDVNSFGREMNDLKYIIMIESRTPSM